MKVRPSLRVMIAISLNIVFWASAYSGIRAGLRSYTPAHLALLRFLVASSVLLVYVIATKHQMKRPALKDLPMIIFGGFAGYTVYHLALNFGETTVSPGIASLIVALVPVFTAIWSHIFLQERMRISGWFGTAISVLGVSWLTLDSGGILQLNRGVLLVLLAAFSESIFFTLQRSYVKKYGSLTYTTYTIWSGTLLMLVFLPGLLHNIMLARRAATLSVIYLGIFPTVISYFSLAYVTSVVGSSKATNFLYVIPVVSFIISWIWFGIAPSLNAVISGMVILLGIVTTQQRNGLFIRNPGA